MFLFQINRIHRLVAIFSMPIMVLLITLLLGDIHHCQSYFVGKNSVVSNKPFSAKFRTAYYTNRRSNIIITVRQHLMMKLNRIIFFREKICETYEQIKNEFISMQKAAIFLCLALATIFTAPLLTTANTNAVSVGTCLLQSCTKELTECIANPKCLANIICLNTCNNRKDEAECQIKCGDWFENDVVGKFNTCAVSQKRCVPQRQNEGLYPRPNIEELAKQFDTSIWNGRWYITAGLNKAFDTFDCQVHFFVSPKPGMFYAKLFWRVTEPDGEIFTKDAIQKFIQDPAMPAHLINHDNEYLHYKDDWYILDYEKDNFVLVYYMGSNDAWDGYGGAFLYTRQATLPKEIVPRLQTALKRSGLPFKWSDFTVTDNSCKPQAESSTILREKFAQRLLITEEKQLQEQLTGARNAAINTIIKEEQEAEKSVKYLENELLQFQNELKSEAQALEKKLFPKFFVGNNQ